MKIIGIVGSNAEFSHNRLLLQFIEKKFSDLFEFEILEIKDIPMFNQDEDQSKSFPVQYMYNKLIRADGVIIATPEHNHTITAALKSTLEWMSFNLHPFENKPVMIMGASHYDQGTSRAQVHLRKILDAPGVNAYVLPGNEFLLGKAKEAFDEEGNIKSEGTVAFLRSCLENFVKYVEVVKVLRKPLPTPPEDLDCTNPISTTVQGVDPDDPEWVEKASEIVGAAQGNDYVRLDHGLLTVDQIDMFLKALPFEVTYADDNNQFLYYNFNKPSNKMLAPRVPAQSGNRLGTVHPPRTFKNVEYLIANLRAGNVDYFRTIVPNTPPEIINVHNYQAMYYPDGSYAGINEIVFDFKPWLDWYLQTTGQRLVSANGAAPAADATSGASNSGHSAPAPAADATSGASDSGHSAPAQAQAVDATSGASEH